MAYGLINLGFLRMGNLYAAREGLALICDNLIRFATDAIALAE